MPPVVNDAVAPDRLRCARQVDALIHPAVDGIEGVGVALEIEVFGRGDPEVAQSAIGEIGEFGEDADQAAGVGVGQGPQQDGVDDAEDGGGRADAEREAGYRRGGEARLLGEAGGRRSGGSRGRPTWRVRRAAGRMVRCVYSALPATMMAIGRSPAFTLRTVSCSPSLATPGTSSLRAARARRPRRAPCRSSCSGLRACRNRAWPSGRDRWRSASRGRNRAAARRPDGRRRSGSCCSAAYKRPA